MRVRSFAPVVWHASCSALRHGRLEAFAAAQARVFRPVCGLRAGGVGLWPRLRGGEGMEGVSGGSARRGRRLREIRL